MTLKDTILEHCPENVRLLYLGGVKGCPAQYTFLGSRYEDDIKGKNCIEDCFKCWAREYQA